MQQQYPTYLISSGRWIQELGILTEVDVVFGSSVSCVFSGLVFPEGKLYTTVLSLF